MTDTYRRSAIVLACIAVPAAVIGALMGAAAGWAFGCVAFLALVTYNVYQLERLRRWAAGAPTAAVPEGAGLWRGVFDAVYRRDRAEKRRRVRLTRLLVRSRQAGRALPYGVAILDHDYRIVWCNDSSEFHFGVSLARDRGQTITHLLRQPEFVAYLNARDYARPLVLKAARGVDLVLSVQFVPFAESQWLLLSHDITQAEKVEAMRRDFVANVSHELRTPLTVLVGFLETIRDLNLSVERARDYVRLMAEQGKRMQQIIGDLLLLSALESAPEPPQDTPVDIGTLLRQLQRDAQALSGGRHRITFDLEDGLDVLGAESELASAFSNLVSNAIRYTGPGGEVRVVWRQISDGAEFAVEDTGPGIAPEHIPRLTERFYRVDRSRSRETGGTGLGLAIVKHALARHQALLDIRSELGKGSRFAARFPARRIAPRVEQGEIPDRETHR